MAVAVTNAGFKFVDAQGNSGKTQGVNEKDREVIQKIANAVNSHRKYVVLVKEKNADWALLSQANTFQQPVTLPAQSGELSALPENQAVTAKMVSDAIAELEVQASNGVTLKMVDSEPGEVENNHIYFYATATGFLDGITVEDPVDLVGDL